MHAAYGNGMAMTGSQLQQQVQQPQQQQQQQQQQQASSKLSSDSPSGGGGYASYFGGLQSANATPDNNVMCRPVH